MLRWLDLMTDQDRRARLGRFIEELTDEVFQVIRWVIVVGFVRFLADSYGAPVLEALYWALAALLFAYLAARFLLRPELRVVPNPARRWQRLLQSLVNLVVCVLAFLAVLWLVETLSQIVAQQRAGG
ncbi:hypothetical protein DDZ14_05930 [Maritimibacter sp. 55A14]|uniref:hypothetical protein n=1 Tax=Maritimibacter sp. 55A14 TaxID=2174844 RepID=UPI000D604D0F|nr:hypothetical protein [Maritimibacter sp. 55A14]PWE33318.1 hypothetical protein DDZ14_05930 [Maritimibacter sp. 55A14]